MDGRSLHFGGVLSRIDQATIGAIALTITRTPLRLKWQGLHYLLTLKRTAVRPRSKVFLFRS